MDTAANGVAEPVRFRLGLIRSSDSWSKLCVSEPGSSVRILIDLFFPESESGQYPDPNNTDL